jgi:hypothetical protein
MHRALNRNVDDAIASISVQAGPLNQVVDALLQRLELNREFALLRLKRAIEFRAHFRARPRDGRLDSTINLALIEDGPARERFGHALSRCSDHPFDPLEHPRLVFGSLGADLSARVS